jgi:Flp pilus assembly protein TadG
MAAAVFPAIGIIGGGVDMSRLYLTRTSLQAACDAGALMGRRTMGSSTWDANDGRANERALALFDTNFKNGAYESEGLTRSFSETNGTVTGTASVEVPMAMMSVFGIKEKAIAVTCTAEMRIPASDIMFVLDTTGSMNCPDDGTSCPGGNNNGVEASNAKIKGLRLAASCFYEALTKQNITAYSYDDCEEEADPAGATSDVRLRFGFVPYAINVNVGRLLPLDYIADQWTYQSREATWEDEDDPDAYDPVYGTPGGYTQVGSPSNSSGSSTGWTNTSAVNLAHSNGSSYSYQYQSNSCTVTVPSEVRTSTGSYTYLSQTPTTPVHPATSVTRNYRRIDTSATYSYRYNSIRISGTRYCRLQYSTSNVVNTTRNFTTTVPVTWTFNPQFEYWTYKPTTLNVSGLKDELNNSWNSTVTLPIGDGGTNRSVAWNGCIEERQTERVNDDDPSDNWNPVPDDALDMDIELAPDPDNTATLWGPLLGGAIYTRDSRSGSSGSGSATTNTFQTTSDLTNTWHSYAGLNYDADQLTEACPTQAQLYEEMDASAFSAYMTGLATGGNTYHDIGLLWGARMMAPNGIFSDITSDTDTWVERHMVFMTDGDTSVSNTNYSAHGVHWWDRRQNDGTSVPSSDWLESNVNARTQAICKWVRDENITLWVVAFGAGISDDTKDDLRDCATPGKFFEADETDGEDGLIKKFKSIANQISALRLTQ